MKFFKIAFMVFLLSSSNSHAQSSASYDQAYEECENLANQKDSDNYDLWEEEFNKCMNKKGFKIENLSEDNEEDF